MLQRPQTLLLLLFCALAAANAFAFPLEQQVFSAVLDLTLAPYVSLVSLVLAFLIGLNIFLYSNRPLQIRINRVVWVLFTLFWGSYVFFVVQHFSDSFSVYLPDLILAFIGELCLLFANRLIRKDENLVRSLDRLR